CGERAGEELVDADSAGEAERREQELLEVLPLGAIGQRRIGERVRGEEFLPAGERSRVAAALLGRAPHRGGGKCAKDVRVTQALDRQTYAFLLGKPYQIGGDPLLLACPLREFTASHQLRTHVVEQHEERDAERLQNLQVEEGRLCPRGPAQRD